MQTFYMLFEIYEERQTFSLKSAPEKKRNIGDFKEIMCFFSSYIYIYIYIYIICIYIMYI